MHTKAQSGWRGHGLSALHRVLFLSALLLSLFAFAAPASAQVIWDDPLHPDIGTTLTLGLTFTANDEVNYTLPRVSGGFGPYVYAISGNLRGLDKSSDGILFGRVSTLAADQYGPAGAQTLMVTPNDQFDSFAPSITVSLVINAPEPDPDQLVFPTQPDLTFFVGGGTGTVLEAATGGQGLQKIYSLTGPGGVRPPGLGFDANVRQITGSPTTADTDGALMTYTVRDVTIDTVGSGDTTTHGTATQTFTIFILAAPGEDFSPEGRAYVEGLELLFEEGVPFEPITLPLYEVTAFPALTPSHYLCPLPFSEGQCNPVTPLPDHLSFDGEAGTDTRVLSGSGSAEDAGEYTFVYRGEKETGSSGTQTTDATFTVFIVASGGVQFESATPPALTWVQGAGISTLTLPALVSNTVAGEPSFTLTPTPTGLSFDDTVTPPTLSGVLDAATPAGALVMTFSATDRKSRTASLTFTATVTEPVPLDPLVFAAELPDLTYMNNRRILPAISALPAVTDASAASATGDVTYTLSSSDLADDAVSFLGMLFEPNSRRFGDTPDEVGSIVLTYRAAEDAVNPRVSPVEQTFRLTVVPDLSAAPLRFRAGVPLSLTLPSITLASGSTTISGVTLAGDHLVAYPDELTFTGNADNANPPVLTGTVLGPLLRTTAQNMTFTITDGTNTFALTFEMEIIRQSGNPDTTDNGGIAFLKNGARSARASGPLAWVVGREIAVTLPWVDRDTIHGELSYSLKRAPTASGAAAGLGTAGVAIDTQNWLTVTKSEVVVENLELDDGSRVRETVQQFALSGTPPQGSHFLGAHYEYVLSVWDEVTAEADAATFTFAPGVPGFTQARKDMVEAGYTIHWDSTASEARRELPEAMGGLETRTIGGKMTGAVGASAHLHFVDEDGAELSSVRRIYYSRRPFNDFLPAAQGGVGPYTYSVVERHAFFTAASFNSGTRAWTGIPSSPPGGSVADYVLTYRVSDSESPPTTINIPFTIRLLNPRFLVNPAVTDLSYTWGIPVSSTDGDYVVLPPYTHIAADGLPAVNYELTDLPAGLTFRENAFGTCTARCLFGTPTGDTAAVNYLVQPVNDAGFDSASNVDYGNLQGTFQFNIVINDPRLHFVDGDGASITEVRRIYYGRRPFNDVLPAAQGGVGPYTYSVVDRHAFFTAASFDSDTRAWVGGSESPPTSVSADYVLTYRVTDSTGTTADIPFTIRLLPPQLTVNPAVTHLTFTRGIPVSSTDGDYVVLPPYAHIAADGLPAVNYDLPAGELPTGLTFAEDGFGACGARCLFGTPTGDTATVGYRVQPLTDAGIDSASGIDFGSVEGTFQFNIVINDLQLQFADEDGEKIDELRRTYYGRRLSINEILPAARGGVGPYTYSIQDRHAFFPASTAVFDPSTRAWTGGSTQQPNSVADYVMTYRVSDSDPLGSSRIDIPFTIRLLNINFRVNPAVTHLTYTRGRPVSSTDGDYVVLPPYTHIAADGLPAVNYRMTNLPAGLTFRENGFGTCTARCLVGTPTGTTATVGYLVQPVTDSGFDSTHDVDFGSLEWDFPFSIVINDPPAFAAGVIAEDLSYTIGQFSVNHFLPEASGGTPDLTYALTGANATDSDPDLPFGMFDGDAARRALSGAPHTTSAAAFPLTYSATDARGAKTATPLYFTVYAVAAPTLVGTVAEPSYTKGHPITALTLPTATDGVAPLSYFISDFDGLAGLSATDADADGTYTLSGTVTSAASAVPFEAAVHEVVWSVADANSARIPVIQIFDNLTFRVSVFDELALVEREGGRNLTFTAGFEVRDVPILRHTPLPPGAIGGTPPRSFLLEPASSSAAPLGFFLHPINGFWSGTPREPASGDSEIIPLNYVVTDANGASAATAPGSLTAHLFRSLSFGAGDVTNGDTIAAAPGSPFPDTTLPAVNGGASVTEALIPDITTDPLFAGLTFDSATRVLSGAPTAAGGELEWRGTDVTGAYIKLKFRIATAGPFFDGATPDLAYTKDHPIEPRTLPAAMASQTGPSAPDGADNITIALTGEPAGLSFNTGTRVLSGTPTADADEYTLTFTATDGQATPLKLEVFFTITIAEPVSFAADAAAAASQTFTVTQDVALTLSLAMGGTDIAASNLNTRLTYTLGDDFAAPNFNGATGLTFTGPTEAAPHAIITGMPTAAGTFALTYAARDANGDTAELPFTLNIVAVPTFEAAQIQGDLNLAHNRAIDPPLTLPVASGGVLANINSVPSLTYTLTGAPAGLTFSGSTRALSGTPTNLNLTGDEVTYTATDATGLSAEQVFSIFVRTPPSFTDAETSLTYTAGQTGIADTTLPAATVGTGLTYSYERTGPDIPGLTLSMPTDGPGVLSGQPSRSEHGQVTATNTTYTRTVTDVSGLTAAHALRVRIVPTPQWPGTVGAQLPDLVFVGGQTDPRTFPERITTTGVSFPDGGLSFTLTPAVPGADPDNPKLPNLTFDGDSTPPKLVGTLLDEAVAAEAYTYTMTDANGVSSSLTFTITVTVAPAFPDQSDILTYTVGQSAAVDLTMPAPAGGVEPYTFSYTSTGPSIAGTGLAFVENTATPGVLSGTPATASGGEITVVMIVTDANGEQDEFTLFLNVANPPRLDGSVADQVYTVPDPVALTFPAVLDGGGRLSFTLTPELPADLNLTFDTSTTPPTLSGAPTGAVSLTEYTFTVYDRNEVTVRDTFNITVNGPLNFPVASLADQTYIVNTDEADVTFPVAGGGTGALAYTLTGEQPLPAGLVFNENGGTSSSPPTLTGTPSEGGNAEFAYTVTDSATPASASLGLTFRITVTGAPTFADDAMIPSQTYTAGAAFSVTLPTATATDAVSHAVENAPANVDWLTTTGVVLSGTPPASAAGETFALQWVATNDTNSAKTRLNFSVTVVAAPVFTDTVPPQSYTMGHPITDLTLPLVASGGHAPIAYAISDFGGLTGLSVAESGGVHTLSGTTSSAVETYTFVLTATDANDATANLTFTAQVFAPITLEVQPLGSLGLTFTAGFPLEDLPAATRKRAPDATGGTPPLTYTMMPAAGFAVALTLDVTLNPRTGAITGTPPETQTTGSYGMAYTVTDANGARADNNLGDFNIRISPPIVFGETNVESRENYRTDKGQTLLDALGFNLTLPEITGGTDPLAAHTLMPDITTDSRFTGLTFDTTTRVLSGALVNNGGQLVWERTDAIGAFAALTFRVITSGPLFEDDVAPQTYTQFKPIAPLTLPLAIPGDDSVQGATPITHVLTGLPDGLTHNRNFVVTGTPAGFGNATLTFTATDSQPAAIGAVEVGGPFSTDLLVELTIIPALTFHATAPSRSWQLNEAIAITLPIASGGVGALDYALTSDPSPLPDWLTYSPAADPVTAGNAGMLTGAIPTRSDFALLTFTVSDSQSPAESTSLNFRVASTGPYFPDGTPDALTNLLYIQNQPDVREDDASADYPDHALPPFPAATRFAATAAEAGPLTYTLIEVVSGTTFSVSGSPGAVSDRLVNDGLRFNPGTRRLSGAPFKADTHTLTYRATDGNGDTADLPFTVRVIPPLRFKAPLVDLRWSKDTTISGKDAGGAAVDYLTLPDATGGLEPSTGGFVFALGDADGNLPAGLAFSNSRRLTGAPTAAGATTLTYTVTGALDLVASATFDLIVTDEPIFTESIDPIGFIEGGAMLNITLPEAIYGGADAVAYAVDDPSTPAINDPPAGMMFDPVNRVLSGMPTQFQASTASRARTRTVPVSPRARTSDFIYTASTATGTATQSFVVATKTVADNNGAPVFIPRGGDCTAANACAITLGPTNSHQMLDLSRYIGDPDGDPLIYVAGSDNEALLLPNGPVIRSDDDRDLLPVSLGPNHDEPPVGLTITATDPHGESAEVIFRVTLSRHDVGGPGPLGAHVALNRVILTELARAIADQNVGAITRRIRQAKDVGKGNAPPRTAFNLGGARTLDGIFTTHTQSLVEGTLNWRRLLSNSEITVPLGGWLNGGGSAGGAGSAVNPAATPLAADSALRAPGPANPAAPASAAADIRLFGNGAAIARLTPPVDSDLPEPDPADPETPPNLVTLEDSHLRGIDPAIDRPHIPEQPGADGTSLSGLDTLAFWASGDYRSLSGKPTGNAIGLDWDGDLYAAHFGADMRPTPDTLAGLAFSWNQSEIDYGDGINPDTQEDISGGHTLQLVTLSPYFSWSALDDRLDLWAVAGYGEGELEIKPGDPGERTATGDAKMQTLALGANGLLLQSGATTLRFKAEGLHSTLEIDDTGGGVAAVEVDASRVRVAVEASQPRIGKDGARLEPSIEIGIRYDGGDGETGDAMELGAGLTRIGATGLSMSGRVYVLLGESSASEWGIQGNLALLPQSTRGFALNLSPGYGVSRTEVQQIWEQDLADIATDSNPDHYAPRMDARLSYTLPAGQGLLTPFSEFTLGDTRSYRFGLDWKLAPQFDLNLTGERSGDGGDNPENAILLKGTLEF